MNSLRDFIRNPVPPLNPQSIPAGKPLPINQQLGAADFQFGQHMGIFPPAASFRKIPDLSALPPISCLFNTPRTVLRQR